MIEGIMAAVSIPVMAKARIGHFVEAQVLEALGVDYIDESEVLTPADENNHIDKHAFKVPFVCGSRNLGEALRRISEGAAMMRTKGEAGTGNIVEAVRHIRTVNVGDPAAPRQCARTSSSSPPRSWTPPRARTAGRRERQAAGRELRRRRDRHPGGRGPGDAARCRGRIRRLRHLQERESGPDGGRDRPGHHPLRQPEDHRRCVARVSAPDARHRSDLAEAIARSQRSDLRRPGLECAAERGPAAVWLGARPDR